MQWATFVFQYLTVHPYIDNNKWCPGIFKCLSEGHLKGGGGGGGGGC